MRHLWKRFQRAAQFHNRHQGAPRAHRRKRALGQHLLSLEPLEFRNLLAVTLSPITGNDTGGVFSVPSGKALYVPLTASDPGQTVSFTATSSNSNVHVAIMDGNPTLQLTVSGIDSTGAAFSGTLTIELFEDLAPDTVDTIENLVNSGFYNGLSFYRIVPNFVAQAGANGTKTAPEFDDEFTSLLSFNSPGMLAMANPGSVDSNTSEFFITDIDLPLSQTAQYLNFRHSIFGQLTSGFDIYQKIMSAQGVSDTDSSPSSPVTITAATIINDNQNGVVQITEPNGFTGTSVITVTATSSDGTTAQRTFTISAAPATQTSQTAPILLETVNNLTTRIGEAVSFQMSAKEYSAGNLSFTVTGVDGFRGTPANVTVSITNVDADTVNVTLTPAAGFTGTINLLAHADDSTYNIHDAQSFSLTVTPPVSIDSVTTPINIGNKENTTVSGTGDAGATITLKASDGTNTTTNYTATVASNGTWTITGVNVSALIDGTITYTATTTDSENETFTDTQTATKDTVAPAVAITSTTNPINSTNSANVTASGTGEVGATIKVTVTDGTTTTTAYTATVAANGTWSITGINVSALADGTLTFTATATDAAGNGGSNAIAATKDTVAPVVAITTVTDPLNLGNVENASASGTGTPGATISLVVTDGITSTSAYTATVAANGSWTITGIDVSPINDGTITYKATITDTSGNTAQATKTATKTAIAVTVTTNPINAGNADSTSASGTGQAGASVTLVVSDGTHTTQQYTTTVSANGTWSISNIDVSELDDGPLTFTATATDDQEHTASHSKTVTKDTVAPTVNVLGVTDPINSGNKTTTHANGTTDAGSTISITATDGTHTTAAKTGTASDTGTWSVTDIDVSALADGEITYTITVTDPSGNSTTVTRTATKDTVAPTVDIDSVTDPIDLAHANSVTISGTGEAGATISVVITDGTNSTTATTTTVAANGTWSVTGINVSTLADGTITYQVTITDAAFNTAQATQTAVKKTVSLTVVTNPVNSANANSASASGTGEPGAAISLVVTDGTHTTQAYTTTIAANGTWSITGINVSSLTDGTITYRVTATDDEDNSAQATKTATKDTVAPTVAVTTVTNPITAANDNTVTIGGTGTVGQLIIVKATDGTNTTTNYSVTVASDGTWGISNIDVSALNDGTITFTATTTDTAGNSASSTITATKNAKANGSLSGKVFVDANDNGKLDAGEHGVAGVIVTLNGTDGSGNALPTQTATTAADGSYQFSGLVAGTYVITQAQPSKVRDGDTTAGTLGGTASANAISAITIDGTAAGTGYNFGELGLSTDFVSMRMFLASSPSGSTLYNHVITDYGTSAPVVTSIVKASTEPVSGSTVTFTVTFNQAVTDVGVSDFAVIASSGITGASVASVTGSGTTYTVTVNVGAGSGTIGLKLVDDDSIIDTASSPLGGSGSGNGTFVGPSYTITSGTADAAISTVTTPINNSNKSNVSASGTGEPGATISLTVTDGTNTTSAYTTTVAANGTWTINGINVSSLADGTLTFKIVATATTGETSQATKTATKDTVAPTGAVSTVTDPVNNGNKANTSASGTGEAGATITLVVSGGAVTSTAYTATVGSNGTWSITGIDVSALPDGTINYTITVKDAAGNTTTSSKAANKDTVVPAVAVTSVTDPIGLANHTNATASGTGEVGATISLVVSDGTNSTTAYTATVGSNGTWTINGIDTSDLADGTLTFTATATDTAGNSATATKTAAKHTVAVLFITSPINAENADQLTVSGTGQAGAAISLVVTNGDHTTTEYTTTVGEDGTWSIADVDVSDLPDGTLTFTATATDDEENSAESSKTAVKDTVAPEAAFGSVTDPINAGNKGNGSASGTGEAGATISLVVTDGTHTTTAYTATVAGNGAWSIAGIDTTSLDDGTVTYQLTATDAAGNETEITREVQKDTVPPNVTIGELTGPIGLSNYNDLEISGTGEAGSTISLVVSDGTHSTTAYTVTVGENGAWTISGIDTSTLDDGELTFTATATDEAGNTAEDEFTVTKTTVAVTSLSTPINAESADGVTVSGTGQVGATITLVAGDGTHNTTAYTTTVGENGTWSIEGIDLTELSDGTVTFTVTADDGQEHSATVTRTAVKDTVVPTIVVSNATDPVNAANAATTQISGTTEAGATVTVVVSDGTNSTSTRTATADSNGAWSITGLDLSDLDDGELTYTVTATDAGGNTAQTTHTTTKDTVAPSVAVTSVTNPIGGANETSVTVSGTGEAGATVSLVGSEGTHSTTTYTATVAENGTWTITGIDTSGLNDGTVTFTATATDEAGNSASDTETATKDTAGPAVAITSATGPISIATAHNATASGTSEAGATISLVVTDGDNTTTAYATTANANGAWTISGIDTSSLADDEVVYTVTATDGQGNSSQAVRSTTKTTVSIDIVTDPVNVETASAVTITGKGEPGAAISVVVTDGNLTSPPYTSSVSAGGIWSISGINASAMANGTITFRVTATDGQNNSVLVTKAATKDSTAPDVELTSVTTPVTAENASATSAGGTGEVGATITLIVTNGSSSSTTYTVVVGAGGTWTINNIDVSGLPDGTLTYTATAADAVGNTANSTLTTTKDTSTEQSAESLVDQAFADEDDWT